MPPDATSEPAPVEDLPRWDLSTRFGFDSPFSEDIDKHLEETRVSAKAFKEKYEGKLESPDEVSLFDAVSEYEQISIRRGIVSSFLSLSYDVKLDDEALKKRKGAVSQLQSSIVGDYLEWFTLDLASLSQAVLSAHKEKTPDLAKYEAFIEEVQRQKPHDLSKVSEKSEESIRIGVI